MEREEEVVQVTAIPAVAVVKYEMLSLVQTATELLVKDAIPD